MAEERMATQWYRNLDNDPTYWAEHVKLDFAFSLDRLIRKSGLTRRDLASRLESSPAYVTKALRGDANLTIESMARLAFAAGGRVHVHIAEIDNAVRWFEVLSSSPSQEQPDPAGLAWAQCASRGGCNGLPLAA